MPDSVPRRYPAQGYVRLRWKVGVRQYVECLEHRVFNGQVTSAAHVHHRNHLRDDNAPGNLVPLDSRAHGVEHRRWRRREIVAAYRAGESTVQLSERLGVHPGTVSRYLAEAGVSARPKPSTTLDEALLRDLHARGVRPATAARELLVSEAVVRRAMKRLSLTSFPAGRPVLPHA